MKSYRNELRIEMAARSVRVLGSSELNAPYPSPIDHEVIAVASKGKLKGRLLQVFMWYFFCKDIADIQALLHSHFGVTATDKSVERYTRDAKVRVLGAIHQVPYRGAVQATAGGPHGRP